MNSHIQQLKNRHWLWQGFKKQQSTDLVKTGYIEFDNKLQGGLPAQGVFDIKTPNGIGELRLLMPYVTNKPDDRLVFLIAPPAHLNAEFLLTMGLPLTRVIIIAPNHQPHALWCAEQCLKSGNCATVLLWHQQLTVSQTRRLALAAESNHASILLFRQIAQTQFSLPVAISLTLAAHTKGIQVAIDKQRGGYTADFFSVSMATQWPELCVKQLSDNVVPFERAKAG